MKRKVLKKNWKCWWCTRSCEDTVQEEVEKEAIEAEDGNEENASEAKPLVDLTNGLWKMTIHSF